MAGEFIKPSMAGFAKPFESHSGDLNVEKSEKYGVAATTGDIDVVEKRFYATMNCSYFINLQKVIGNPI